MVVIRYVGTWRRGTVEPRRIWMPGEAKDVPPDVARRLLEDPNFVKVEGAKPEQRAPSKEKRYRCTICGATYTTRSALNRHIRTKHG